MAMQCKASLSDLQADAIIFDLPLALVRPTLRYCTYVLLGLLEYMIWKEPVYDVHVVGKRRVDIRVQDCCVVRGKTSSKTSGSLLNDLLLLFWPRYGIYGAILGREYDGDGRWSGRGQVLHFLRRTIRLEWRWDLRDLQDVVEGDVLDRKRCLQVVHFPSGFVCLVLLWVHGRDP